MPKETVFHSRYVEPSKEKGEFIGYWVSNIYRDLEEEYWALRTKAGLFDASSLRRWEIKGGDALKLVNRIITRDASRLETGQACYTAVCNEKGMLIDDCTVFKGSASTTGLLFFCSPLPFN